MRVTDFFSNDFDPLFSDLSEWKSPFVLNFREQCYCWLFLSLDLDLELLSSVKKKNYNDRDKTAATAVSGRKE